MSSPFPQFFTPSNMTFDASVKLNFAAYLFTLYLGGNKVRFFLGFLLLGLVGIKTCSFRGTQFFFVERQLVAFVFKLQAPVVQKVANVMHWIFLYQTDSACNSVVSLILHVLWITIFPVDKQLEPVSQS